MNEVQVNDGPYYKEETPLRTLKHELMNVSPLILEELSIMKARKLKKELRKLLLMERIIKILQERHVHEALELRIQGKVKKQEVKVAKKHARKEAKKEKKGMKTKLFTSIKNINLKNQVKKIKIKTPSFKIKKKKEKQEK